MSGHYRQMAAARREGECTAESDSRCEGATVWALGWQRVPLDEGQASLGEALVTVHTCRLLLQPRRRFKVQSPMCRHCPRGEGQSLVVEFAIVFQHHTQHKVIAKDFALQIILFTLAYSEKTDFKLISKNYLGHHQTRVRVSYSQESNVMCVTVQWGKKGFLPTTTLGLLHAS